jgi:hypothetical protein
MKVRKSMTTISKGEPEDEYFWIWVLDSDTQQYVKVKRKKRPFKLF